jgi:hypothetical protein
MFEDEVLSENEKCHVNEDVVPVLFAMKDLHGVF